MPFIKVRIFLIVFTIFFLSSCTPTVFKVYEGDLRDPSEVAFVYVSKGTSIIAVNGQMFTSAVPGIILGRKYIELAAPQTYTLTAWNNHVPIQPEKTKEIQLEAEAGKIYFIFGDNGGVYKNSYFNATLTEIIDTESINKFYDRFTTGSLERQHPEPVASK